MVKASLVKKFEKTAPKSIFWLAGIFFVIWIVIGLLVIVLMAQAFRAGALSSVSGNTTTPQSAQQVPTETEIPGVGVVNIECTQNALSPESIQSLLQSGDINVLGGEERTSFEECIVS